MSEHALVQHVNGVPCPHCVQKLVDENAHLKAEVQRLENETAAYKNDSERYREEYRRAEAQSNRYVEVFKKMEKAIRILTQEDPQTTEAIIKQIASYY